FKEYGKGIIDNAQALCNGLLNRGIDIVSGGTDNHLMLVDLVKKGLTGKEVEGWLDDANITANKNTIPNDPQSPFVTSGIRVGTPAVTSRGFGTEEMKTVARLIGDVARDFEGTRERVTREVAALCEKFPIYS
ncbi:MAG: serine hydroxymethyltransferase, partial [Clostridia bacterium]|nr:serine hydroxymethyltransferase [Clostridia bacterium]